MSSLSERTHRDIAGRTDRIGDKSMRITNIVFENEAHEPLETAYVGEPLRICIDYECTTRHGTLEVYVWFVNHIGSRVTLLCNRLSGELLRDFASSGKLVCSIPEVSLTPGQYLLDASLVRNGDVADGVCGATQLDIEPGPFFPTGKTPLDEHGTHLTRHSWTARPA
jgi:hypothetical protein